MTKLNENIGLAEIYKNHFLIGTCFRNKDDLSGKRYELIKKHFNVVTAENNMKPCHLRGDDGSFKFDIADEMCNALSSEGFTLHGHVLLWHEQSPDWLIKDENGELLTRGQAVVNLTKHINVIAKHFTGKVYSWDVVNESIVDNPDPKNWRASLRKEGWYNVLGADCIDMAFKLARDADPNAVLYYNDYNLDNPEKAQAVAAMVKEINDAYIENGNSRLLIEGVGMQGHYNIFTKPEDVEASVNLFKSIGVIVSITELDVQAGGGKNDKGDSIPELSELRQAYLYAELFRIFKKHSDVIERVTLWGIDDVSSWRSSAYPLLFNGDLSPKKAFFAICDPDGFIENNIKPEVELITGIATYGTPVLNNSDPLWNTAEELQISILLQAWQTAQGTARVLWDEENLYVRVMINEENKTGSVEVFFDEMHCKRGEYRKCDRYVCADFDNSSIVEMKLPFKVVKPSANMQIGLDFQINDVQNGEVRGVAKWADASNQSHTNTSRWGTVILKGDLK